MATTAPRRSVPKKTHANGGVSGSTMSTRSPRRTSAFMSSVANRFVRREPVVGDPLRELLAHGRRGGAIVLQSVQQVDGESACDLAPRAQRWGHTVR